MNAAGRTATVSQGTGPGRGLAPYRLPAVSIVPALIVGFFAIGTLQAASYSTAAITIRGKEQVLFVYEPAAGVQKRPLQVLITSGDVGWIGLPVDIAEHTQKLGFRTIGFNARAYLSSFTGRNERLGDRDIPGDYQAILNWATADPRQPREVVIVGVSEGAGLAILGMGQDNPARGCKGVIALGLPIRTSLGWYWTDFPMWITKKDPRQPQAETRAYLSGVKVPLVMIHSTRDEWDPIEDARKMFSLHPGPKRFISVNAVNHRFSDKIAEVLGHIEQSLQWLQNQAPQAPE
jgi:pimeloyl-ACP methyl ester carboxylesterase